MPWQHNPQTRRRENAVYGPQWRKVRAQALARDRYRCVLDGSTTRLTVDHIVPVSQGGTHQLTNLQTLCEQCHMAKTSMEGRGFRQQTPADPTPKPTTAW